MVALPRKVLNYHGIGAFVAKARCCLHEIQVLILAVVCKQMVLMLQIHLFKFDIDVFDLLQKILILQQLHFLATELILFHLGQIKLLYAFAYLGVDLLVWQTLQVCAYLYSFIALFLTKINHQSTIFYKLFVELRDPFKRTTILLRHWITIEIWFNNAIVIVLLLGNEDASTIEFSLRSWFADLVNKPPLVL